MLPILAWPNMPAGSSNSRKMATSFMLIEVSMIPNIKNYGESVVLGTINSVLYNGFICLIVSFDTIIKPPTVNGHLKWAVENGMLLKSGSPRITEYRFRQCEPA